MNNITTVGQLIIRCYRTYILLRFVAALLDKLVPCAWLSSGALDVWSLRLREKPVLYVGDQ